MKYGNLVDFIEEETGNNGETKISRKMVSAIENGERVTWEDFEKLVRGYLDSIHEDYDLSDQMWSVITNVKQGVSPKTLEKQYKRNYSGDADMDGFSDEVLLIGKVTLDFMELLKNNET